MSKYKIVGGRKAEVVVEWEVGRARVPGPRLGEGSRQPRPGVGGMREGGSTEGRWQSSHSGRGDGARTDNTQPREDLHARRCFTEVEVVLK